MSIKLRDLIRSVRACKTAAEERAVIAKECALIRTAIKEEQEQFRHRNVAKLMYIHMLGYPTHFGQMECLKLISAPTFPEKRIGYLGLTLLLTESTEVLTLVTNSLKIDLSNSNQYIVALSLIAIGNLATQDMARDLASDVEKLLKANNSYLRKKAALATIRLLRKEPDLIEHMSERIISLLKDRAHGVLITGVQLMTEVIEMAPEYAANYAKLVPSLVRLLRNFISMGYSPEHDVSGITDPFLQVKLLHLLKYLGKGNEEASDQMNDVLAQVATNTETAKNAGNAILYECVQTIMDVESDSGLRVLAVNILGRFLLNRDNNIRYVALNTLSKVVSEDIGAVQRHRTTIVDCLKDNDISIRQRALELIYQLVNEQNVANLTTELLNYLMVVQSDHKANLVSKIMQVVEKYSPSKKWRVDTVITLLSIAGNHSDESISRTAIIFIAQADGLQAYAVHKLFRCLTEDTSHIGLVHVALWCLGEYGDLLIRYCGAVDEDSPPFDAVEESALIEMLEKCTRLHNADVSTKSLALNALVKLSIRVSAASKPSIHEIITSYSNSMAIELQQRSVEYTMLMSSQWDNLRSELLGKMPVLDEATMRKKRAAFEEGMQSGDSMPISSSSGGPALSVPSQSTQGFTSTTLAAPKSGSSNNGGSSLLDLDDIFGGGSSSSSGTAVASSQQNAHFSQPSSSQNSMMSDFGLSSLTPSMPTHNTTSADLLSDIFSSVSLTPSPVVTPQQFQMQSTMGMGLPPQQQQSSLPSNDLLMMGGGGGGNIPTSFGNLPSTTPTLNPQGQGQGQGGPLLIKAFEKAGLQITFEVSKPNPMAPGNTRVICKFSNSTPLPMTNLSFQAAVPKYLKIELLPASSNILPPNSNGAVTQEVRLINSMQGEKNIMLKLKINYSHGGKVVDELAQVSSFPPMY